MTVLSHVSSAVEITVIAVVGILFLWNGNVAERDSSLCSDRLGLPPDSPMTEEQQAVMFYRELDDCCTYRLVDGGIGEYCEPLR